MHSQLKDACKDDRISVHRQPIGLEVNFKQKFRLCIENLQTIEVEGNKRKITMEASMTINVMGWLKKKFKYCKVLQTCLGSLCISHLCIVKKKKKKEEEEEKEKKKKKKKKEKRKRKHITWQNSIALCDSCFKHAPMCTAHFAGRSSSNSVGSCTIPGEQWSQRTPPHPGVINYCSKSIAGEITRSSLDTLVG